MTQGLLIKRVNPEYPKKARTERIQGTVVLNARIGIEGDIVDLFAASGDLFLVKAAINAAKQWKYEPYVLRSLGKARRGRHANQVNFALRKPGGVARVT